MYDYIEERLSIKIKHELFLNYSITGYKDILCKIEKCSFKDKEFFVITLLRNYKIDVILKIIDNIKSITKLNTVFYFKSLMYKREKEFLRNKIPFVVDNRIIYLPFLLTVYEEVNNPIFKEKLQKGTYKDEFTTLSFNTQKILCIALSKGIGVYPMQLLQQFLNMSVATISRCLDELETNGLNVVSYNKGLRYLDLTSQTPESLFELLYHFKSPVTKQYFVDVVVDDLPYSSLSALSYYLPQFKYDKIKIYGLYKNVFEDSFETKLNGHKIYTNYSLVNNENRILIQELAYDAIVDTRKAINPFTAILTLNVNERLKLKKLILAIFNKYFFSKKYLVDDKLIAELEEKDIE